MTSLVLVDAPTPTQATLAQLHDLRGRLEDTVDIDDARSTVDRADAIRSWVRVARLRGEVAFEAGELHVRAQRRAGELLLEYIAAAGTTTRHHPGEPRTMPRNSMPKGSLAELGIDPKRSGQWQQMARIPSEEFELRIQACREAGRPPATEPFLRAAARFLLPKRRRVTTTLGLLRRALLALRDVHILQTSAEIAEARRVGKRGMALLELADKAETGRLRPQGVQRSTSCLLCGRGQPLSKPERCLDCGGAWFTC